MDRLAAHSLVRALALAIALAPSACAASPRPWRGATPETWPVLQRALVRARASRATEPWSAAARVTVTDPRGRRLLARGGLAVAPGAALRMILVGVAGSTLLDAWVTPRRWRVAVPPIGLVRRGGQDAPPELPVAFLRWWFFTPLEGRLFAATVDDDGGPTWLLRDGRAVVELHGEASGAGPRLAARRLVDGRSESVDERRAGPRPSRGDTVHYEESPGGLALDIALDEVSAAPPDAEAFADPEAAP